MNNMLLRVIKILLLIMIIFISISWQEVNQTTLISNETADVQIQPKNGNLLIHVPDEENIAIVEINIKGDNFEEIYQYELIKADTGWKGIISDIPAGEERILDVSAYSLSEDLIYTGNAMIDIIENNTATVIIKLHAVLPLPDDSSKPVIENVVIFPDKISPGDSINLDITARSPDSNEPLFYQWSCAGGGAFEDSESSITYWTSPMSNGIFGINITVFDNMGNTDTLRFNVEVDEKYNADSIPVEVQCFSTWNWYYYYAPRIKRIYADPAKVEKGEPINLDVIACNSHSSELSYSWHTPLSGSFDNRKKKDPVFTVSKNASPGWYRMKVIVSNQHYSARGVKWIKVIQSSNFPPEINSVQADPRILDRGETTSLFVDAVDPEGEPLYYEWTSSAPGVFNDINSSHPFFTVNTDAVYGNYIIIVNVSDGIKCERQSIYIEIKPVDLPPVIHSVTLDPPTAYRGDTVSLAVSASDPGDDALSYRWTTTCPGTFSSTTTATPLFTVGSSAVYRTYTFTVTVNDANNQVSASAELTVLKPDSPPIIHSVKLTPSAAYRGDTVNVAVSVSDPDGDSLTYKWTTTCPGTFNSTTVAAPLFTVDYSAGYRTYPFTVTVSDANNQVSASAELTVLKVDSPPVIHIVVITPSSAYRGDTVSMAVLAEDPEGGTLTYKWTTTCPGSFSSNTVAVPRFTVDSSAGYRTYPFAVTVSDGNNQVSAYAELTVLQEDSPPVIHVVTLEPSSAYRGETVSLTVSASDPEGGSLTYSWTTGCPGTFNSTTVADPLFTVDASAGYQAYSFTVIVSDGNNQVSAYAKLNILQLDTPPVIHSVTLDPPAAYRGDTVRLAVSASNPGGGFLTYEWTTNCPGTFNSPTTATPLFTVDSSAGYQTYTFTVTVSNATNQASSSVELTVIQVDTPPVIQSVSILPSTAYRGDKVRLMVSASDPEGGSISYKWTTHCPGTFNSTTAAAPLFTVGSSAGYQTYSFTVTVSDGKNQVSAFVELSVERQNSPPFIFLLSTDPARLDRNGSTKLMVEALDYDGDSLSFTWSSDCPGFFDNPENAYSYFTVSPSAAYGAYTVTASVSDGLANSAKSRTLVVEYQNKPPVIQSLNAEPTRISRGGSTNLSVTASDADNDILTYRWTATETGIFYNPETNNPRFTINENVDSEECTITVYISDGITEVPASITINIWEPVVNQAPVILSSFQGSDEIPAGKQVIFRVRAKDPEGGNLRFEWKKLDGKFNTPTIINKDSYVECIIVWTAPAFSANPVVIKVDILDEAGLGITKEFLPITVTGGIVPSSEPKIQHKLGPPVETSNAMFGYSVDIYGNRIISSYTKENSLGAVAVYELASDSCKQVGTLQASDEQSGDYFGRSIAIDQDIIAVGAASEDGGAGNPIIDCGAVYVYERLYDGNWIERQILHAADAALYDRFGSAVAVDDNYLAIGAIQEDGGDGSPVTNCGAVYVFKQDIDGSWNESAVLRGSDRAESDFFGCAVDIRGSYMIVGARGRDKPGSINTGVAYIFRLEENGTWEEADILEAPDPQYGDYFGISVAIGDQYAVIGAEKEDGGAGDPASNTGAAYTYRLIEETGEWLLSSILHAPDKKPDDSFGCAVSLYNDRIIIGSMKNDTGSDNELTNSGAVYIYKQLANDTCSLLKKMEAPDAQASDYFSGSVSIYGSLAVIGAKGEDGGEGNPVTNAGAFYILEF